jgi:hypothetical protein
LRLYQIAFQFGQLRRLKLLICYRPRMYPLGFAVKFRIGVFHIFRFNVLNALPDLFREGQGIVATGVLTGASNIKAQEVLAKHDEEYMPPELAEKMKGIKHVKPENMPSYESTTGSGGK